MASADNLMEKIVSLSKRRGFIFQSSEVYGGLGSTWDYGPLGVEMKKKIVNSWWREMVTSREDVVGMDAAILMHPRVWESSGHVDHFHDFMVDNKKTKRRYRLDHLLEGQSGAVIDRLAEDLCGISPDSSVAAFEKIQRIVRVVVEKGGNVDLNAYGIVDIRAQRLEAGDWTVPRQFNLMFKTYIGPSEDSSSQIYLRPETAQGIFVNFANVQATSRRKLPFGVAQVGKAFRNEITTGNFLFRTREFEQMEMEFFVHPEETTRWLDYWSTARLEWYQRLGIKPQKLRLRPHGEDELAHYSTRCYDVEYEFPFGWSELEGIADRGAFDLNQHNTHAERKQTYFDPLTNQHIVPAVVEASGGVDRTFLTCLVDAFREEEVRGETRTVLQLDPRIAPITCAVFPLVNRDGQPELSHQIASDIRQEFSAFYDSGGSIGRRYRRQDEAGTPFGITVDHQTMEDNTVTLRDRDSMEQVRVERDQIRRVLRERLKT